MAYDSYIPEGIFKADWLHKHVNVYPAVVTLLVDWNECVRLGAQKETEIISIIEMFQKFALSLSLSELSLLIS